MPTPVESTISKKETNFYVTAMTAGNEVINYSATSNFTTLGIDLTEFDAKWTLQVIRSATDGLPTLTIECSDNNVDFKEYQLESTDISVRTGEMFKKNNFEPRFMRVKYTANSATGTITVKLYK